MGYKLITRQYTSQAHMIGHGMKDIGLPADILGLVSVDRVEVETSSGGVALVKFCNTRDYTLQRIVKQLGPGSSVRAEEDEEIYPHELILPKSGYYSLQGVLLLATVQAVARGRQQGFHLGIIPGLSRYELADAPSRTFA